MKVLFVPVYRRNPYQLELARNLEALGVKVAFGTGREGRDLRRLVEAQGTLDVLHIHWTHDLALAQSLRESLQRSAHFSAELLALKRKGLKIVWTVHNLLEHEKRHPRFELFSHRVFSRIYDRLIVHCTRARDEIIRAYWIPRRRRSRIHVIPHGHLIGAYENRVTREESRKTLGFDPEDRVFLFFGNIRGYKSIPHLIDAFGRLKDPRARLLIVGRVMRAEGLPDEVAERLGENEKIRTVLEFVPDDAVQSYMNASDVVVLPLREILTSSTVLLGMSFAKAIVCPRVGCLPEVVDEEGGILYDPDEREGLSQAMEAALEADLPQMGRHNYQKAKGLGWEEIARRTFEVYRAA